MLRDRLVQRRRAAVARGGNERRAASTSSLYLRAPVIGCGRPAKAAQLAEDATGPEKREDDLAARRPAACNMGTSALEVENLKDDAARAGFKEVECHSAGVIG